MIKRVYILLSEKQWHLELFSQLERRENERWVLIQDKNDFTFEWLSSIRPDKIFIPHWSHLIPKTIYENFNCVVFHMTDLPFGRGGSPLQNLIVRGYKTTKISAIKVEKGIDTGAIYLKKGIKLSGSASEIFKRSIPIIESMINEIIDNRIVPIPQKGEIVEFKRRKPEEGNIGLLYEMEEVYNYIRMLDCEGYPPAFIETLNFKIEFTSAIWDKENNRISADVRITKK